MLIYLTAFFVAFIVNLIVIPVLIKKFTLAKITGKDVHKKGKPEIPEMGGIAIVAGVVSGTLAIVAISTLSTTGAIEFPEINTNLIFASLTTLLAIAIIGIFDDLVVMSQHLKAILPVFAAIPLIAIAAGSPQIYIPFIGQVYLPYLYPLVLIPIGITGASNATNMLAGFNGLEASLGLIGCAGLSIIAFENGSAEALVITLSMCGALLAFLRYNSYPARIFPGDVGTLGIGAVFASAVIIGNFELAGIIIIIPYFVDFVIKLKNRMPKEIEYTKLENDGKIVATKVVGLPTLILKLTSGLKERDLVMSIVAIEVVFTIIAVIVV